MYDIIKVYVSIQPRLITLKNFIQDFFIMIKAVDSNRDHSRPQSRLALLTVGD